MVFGRKSASPIDRAVEDLDRQIGALQKQLRELSVNDSSPGPVSLTAPLPGAPPSPAIAAVRHLKELLTPPKRSPLTPSHGHRQDLFDISVEPLKDLEAEPIAFSRKAEPDLFSRAEESERSSAEPKRPTPVESAPEAERKLMHYLSAGSIKTYKPLKHVQRQTRNRFFMWLGLSLVALWILYAVIR